MVLFVFVVHVLTITKVTFSCIVPILAGMFFSVKKQDVVRYKVRNMERLYKVRFPEASKKHGKRIENVIMIFDMDGE